MKSVGLGMKLTEAEEELFQEVQVLNPMIKRAALAEVLLILGIIEYMRRLPLGVVLDPQKIVEEATAAIKHQTKKAKR